MHITAFLSPGDADAARLVSRLHTTFPESRLDLFHTLDTFVMYTRRQPCLHSVVLLYIRDAETLHALLNSAYDPSWTPSVLVLPSSDPHSISLGWQLNPRHLTTATGDFEDVIAVLRYLNLKQNDTHNYTEAV